MMVSTEIAKNAVRSAARFDNETNTCVIKTMTGFQSSIMSIDAAETSIDAADAVFTSRDPFFNCELMSVKDGVPLRFEVLAYEVERSVQ
jgi:hypothetical protein